MFFFCKKLLKKTRDLKKKVIEQLRYRKKYFTVQENMNETQTAETFIQSAFSLWVDCCRLAIAFINVRFELCVQYSREWSSNKRSNLFAAEFNARVNWIRPATRVGAKPGRHSKPLTNFYALFEIFIKMLCWSMFHVKPLNKLPTTCILNWGPLFLHGSIYSRL